jgi:hypothetical protein
MRDRIVRFGSGRGGRKPVNVWDTDSLRVDCPYCGERIEIVVDLSVETQTYIEDCSVCCRPITFTVVIDDDGRGTVHTAREDE